MITKFLNKNHASGIKAKTLSILSLLFLGSYFNINAAMLQEIRDHKARIDCLINLKNGKIASGSGDGKIKIWDFDLESNNYTCTQTLEDDYSCSPTTCLIDLENGLIASGHHNSGKIKIWNLEKNKLEFSFAAHDWTVTSLIYLKDTKKIISGSHDNTIKIWNADTYKCESTLINDSGVTCLSYLGNNKLASGHDDGTIKVFNLTNNELEIHDYRVHTKPVTSLANLENDLFASVSNYEIIIFDLAKKQHSRIMSNSLGQLVHLGAGKIALTSYQNTIEIFDILNKKHIKTLTGHSNMILSLTTLSKTGETPITKIASGSIDHDIKIWDISI